MFKTHGLTHVALSVADLERSLRFYRDFLGVEEYFRDETSVHVKGPGAWDILTFQLDRENAGGSGGIIHFGFRLVEPGDIDSAVEAAVNAGGRLLRRGEFAPGFPFAYISDPDGYEIEIWFE